MECVLVRPASTVVCVCVALVFPQLMLLMVVWYWCVRSLTQSSRLLAYCDVCVLKMREIFRFQAVD